MTNGINVEVGRRQQYEPYDLREGRAAILSYLDGNLKVINVTKSTNFGARAPEYLHKADKLYTRN